MDTLETAFRAAFGRSMHDELLNNLPADCEVARCALQTITAAHLLIQLLPDIPTLLPDVISRIDSAVEHQISVFYYG